MQCENAYEIAWWKEGKKKIIGIDEAGRGPIAGPLVVAAVSFPVGFSHESIYDSKKLSEKKRKALFQEIIQLASEFIEQHSWRCWNYRTAFMMLMVF